MVTDYDYSAGHIRELLAVANLRKMSLPEHFDEASVDFLQKIYNGIGPEAWGGKFRARMTRLLAWLEAPALIHDWEYVCQPKTYAAFSRANLRLVWNAFKDGRFKIGLAAGILCQIGGWRGFRKTAEVSSGNLADYERLERLGSLGCLGKSDGIGTRNPTEVENDHL